MTDAVVVTDARAHAARRDALDCAALEAADRFDAWTQAVSQSFVPLSADLKNGGAAAFAGSLVSQSLGRAEINTVTGSAVSVRRSARSIAQNNPGYIKLGLQLRGYSVISQDDRDAALAPGDFAIYDTTRPYVLDFDDSFQMFVVMFPAEALRFDRSLLKGITASRFSGRRGLGAVTSTFLGEMSRQLANDPLEGGLPLADAVLDLITATLSERLGAAIGTDEATRRRALVMQIETAIANRLGDPALTVQSIADAHHVSVRYLQKLFEERHETVSGFIRSRRLEQCRRDLSDEAHAGHSVASIGARWGFADAAAFSRAFRAEFGVTPTDFRAAARGR